MDELVVGGNTVRNTRGKVKAKEEFWEEISGMNEAADKNDVRLELETGIDEDINDEISL